MKTFIQPNAIRAAGSEPPIVHGSRYVGIQSLRAIAAVIVVIMHSIFYMQERLGANKWTFPSGVSGVDIFFIISGFVMFYSSRELVYKQDGWKTFAFRRIIRIVPLYWIATTIKLTALLVAPAVVLHARLSAATVILSYLFLPSRNFDGQIEPLLGVGWTLTFEMFFYAVFALALFLRVNLLRFVGAIMLACSVASIFRRQSWPPASVYLDSMTLEFFFGMFLAKLCLMKIKLPARMALIVFPFILIALLGPWQLPGPRFIKWGLPAFMLCWCAASAEDIVYDKIPRFILFVADASYALYLFHPLTAPAGPVILKLAHFHSPYVSLALSLGFALAGGAIAYKLIDVPIINYFRNRRQRRSNSSAHG
jgi:peptidoglycan/LPS O-acetylase OafA/YrhL